MTASAAWGEVLTAARHPARADVPAALDVAVRLGLDVHPGVVACSVTERIGPGWRTPHASSDVALELDEAQYRADAGPCVDAASNGHVVQLTPLTEGPQLYATFAAAAARRAVQASLSVPLPADTTRAALNLYAATPTAFDERRPRQIADLLARVCAALLRGEASGSSITPTDAREGGQPDEAAARRDAAMVNTALDIVQRTGSLSRDDAHDWLISRSVRQGRSMIALAADLVGIHGHTRGPA